MDGAWIDGGGHFEIAAEGIGQLDLAGIAALGLEETRATDDDDVGHSAGSGYV